ncbi:type II toxin-antitoxin system RelE/ParE family toxin [bacterium]|nr:type II toxin-antitoxin system RelE/ParE family toxin [bacterium]
MIVEFKESFKKDLEKILDKKILVNVNSVIEQVEDSHSLDQLNKLKKLKGYKTFYRIRIGDYRIGLTIERSTVSFVRILHRKDIYKFFP